LKKSRSPEKGTHGHGRAADGKEDHSKDKKLKGKLRTLNISSEKADSPVPFGRRR